MTVMHRVLLAFSLTINLEIIVVLEDVGQRCRALPLDSSDEQRDLSKDIEKYQYTYLSALQQFVEFYNKAMNQEYCDLLPPILM